MDLREHDARAVRLAAGAVDAVGADHWELTTPCAPWTVRDLVKHMVGQNLRFGAAVRGEDPDEACPLDGPDLGSEPSATFRRSAEVVRDAFADYEPDQIVTLPELAPRLTAQRVVGAHFVDFLAHQWDVAVSVGTATDVPKDLVTAGIELAERLPGTARGGPDTAFAAIVEPLADGGFERYLGLVGRNPDWRP